MDLRRLRAGEWIAAVSGVVLLVTMSLPWYHVDIAGSGRVKVSAWEAFTVVDILLGLTALAAVALLVIVAAQRTAAVGIAFGALLTILAGVVSVIVLIRVLNIPGDIEELPGTVTSSSRAAFSWVGLLATWGILVGGMVSMRDERLSKPGHPTDAAGAPAAPPEIETLPAPPRNEPA